MVKNTIGGKKTKAFSRKDSYASSSNNALRLPEDDLECFAKVTKLFGNSMCQVTLLHNNLSLIAHIRAKMTGKNKRLFTIHLNDFVIVGLRHWESSPKHCDIIHIYSHFDINLISSLPSFSHLFSNLSSHEHDHDSILFSNINLDSLSSLSPSHDSINSSTLNLELNLSPLNLNLDDI